MAPKINLQSLEATLLLEVEPQFGDIACVTCHEQNLYIATSAGVILHYYQFEDAANYILLTDISVSHAITKMMILPNLQRLLVLANSTTYLFSLPELSPVNIGKLQGVNDILPLSYSLRKDDSGKSTPTLDDKIVAFTSSKIRIISIKKDLIKLARDINYLGSISGVSTASKMSSNFSNLVLVANGSNYDIIDMQNNRKIPLFDYDQVSTEKIDPIIIPFKSGNPPVEEYLLTIKSDDSTSIAMFINSLGDVTRGTISFMNYGYPKSLAILWPHVYGIFNVDNSFKLVISDLSLLENIETIDLNQFLYGNLKADVSNEKPKKTIAAKLTDGGLSNNDSLTQSSKNNSDDIITPDDDESYNSNNKSNDKSNNEVSDEPDDESNEESKDVKNSAADGDDKNKTLPGVEGKTNRDTGFVEQNEGEVNEFEFSAGLKILNYQICEVREVRIPRTHLLDLLSKINIETGERVKPAKLNMHKSNLLIHGNHKLWTTQNEEPITIIQRLFDIALMNDAVKNLIPELLKYPDSFEEYVEYIYLQHLIVFALLYTADFDLAMDRLLTVDNGRLVIDPKLVAHVLTNLKLDNLQIFGGLEKLIKHKKFTEPQYSEFALIYLGSLNFDLIGEDGLQDIKEFKYSHFNTSLEVIYFIEEFDSKLWTNFKKNEIILSNLQEKSLFLALLHVYGIMLDSKVDEASLSFLFCDMGIKLLSGELKDKHFQNRDNSKLVEQVLYQLKTQKFDEEIYAKYLLEILKIDQTKVFEYMMENKNHEHNEMHKKLMNDIPKSQANALDFSLLKVEYLESSLIEDKSIEKLISLLDEIIQVLISKAVLTEQNLTNLQILIDTYKIENALSESKWPKISWIGYLHANLNRTEASDLIGLYLKAFELMLHLNCHGSYVSIDLIQKYPELTYLSFIGSDEAIPKLLEVCDFSSAEYYAVNGHLPSPVNSFYFLNEEKSDSIKAVDVQKSNLKLIFDYYILESAKDSLNLSSVRHFIQSYGNSVFNSIETLSMLPDNIPLIYIHEYLNEVIVDLNNSAKVVAIKKALNKADSKFTKSIFNDLNELNA